MLTLSSFTLGKSSYAPITPCDTCETELIDTVVKMVTADGDTLTVVVPLTAAEREDPEKLRENGMIRDFIILFVVVAVWALIAWMPSTLGHP